MGGFSIDHPNRFYSFHYITPILAGLSIFHISQYINMEAPIP
jgi:quinol-cytochrome oxidoreductase complex cytochrome b subunit